MSKQVFVAGALQKEIAPPNIGKIKERVRHAARELGWEFSRTDDLWRCDRGYDRQYNPSHEEIRDIEHYTGIRYGKQEVSELDHLISKADNLLESQDTDFHSAFIDAVRTLSRIVDSSRTKE